MYSIVCKEETPNEKGPALRQGLRQFVSTAQSFNYSRLPKRLRSEVNMLMKSR